MSHRRDVGRFDEWAPTYERHWMQRRLFGPMQSTVLDLAAEQVPRPLAVLDIGCGTGRLLRAAQARFHDASFDGVDASREMVREANALLPERSPIRIQQATAEDLPFPDHVFDLVFSTMTFHHWADQRKGMAEIRRVLAPAGRWVLADFIATGFFGAFARAFLKRVPERRRLGALAGEAGLELVAERAVPGTMHNVRAVAIAVQQS